MRPTNDGNREKTESDDKEGGANILASAIYREVKKRIIATIARRPIAISVRRPILLIRRT